jgi:hypothetical protein
MSICGISRPNIEHHANEGAARRVLARANLTT